MGAYGVKRVKKIPFLVTALAAVAAVLTAASPPTASHARSEADPVCRAVLETLSRGDIYPSSPPRTNVGVRLRCNFELRHVSFRTSKPLERVYERPKLEGPDPGDSLRCRQSSRTLGVCDGTVGEDVRILSALRVKGGPCGRNPLRATFRVSGGIDCEPGEACAAIAYTTTVRVEEPRGC